MPEHADVFFDNSPVFATLDGFKVTCSRSSNPGSPLLSGYLLGEKYTAGSGGGARREAWPRARGLIGFRPQWRGQPFGTFRVLFNAALYHGAVAAAAKGTPGFWAAATAGEPR